MFVKQKLIFIISIITFQQHQRANGSHVEVTKAENLDFERQKVREEGKVNRIENFGQHFFIFWFVIQIYFGSGASLFG